jgi:hypothetical protein
VKEPEDRREVALISPSDLTYGLPVDLFASKEGREIWFWLGENHRMDPSSNTQDETCQADRFLQILGSQ